MNGDPLIDESKTKFVLDGRAVQVIAETDEGYVVRCIMEDDEGNEYLHTDIDLFDQVFDEPPRYKLDAMVDKLRKEYTDLNRQQWSLKQDIAKLQRDHEQVLEELDQYECLVFLRDYLAGNITHLVCYNEYRPLETLRVNLVQEELKGHYGGFKSITLYGYKRKAGRDVFNNDKVWRVMNYSSDSGSTLIVVAFATSEAEALEAGRAWIAEYMQNNDDLKPTEEAIEVLTRFRYLVPKDWPDRVLKDKATRIKNKMNKKKDEIQELEAELVDLVGDGIWTDSLSVENM